MTELNKYGIEDLVVSAMEQKPDEFSDAFNALIVDRIGAAVETRKQEIAASMFNREVATEEPEEE